MGGALHFDKSGGVWNFGLCPRTERSQERTLHDPFLALQLSSERIKVRELTSLDIVNAKSLN